MVRNIILFGCVLIGSITAWVSASAQMTAEKNFKELKKMRQHMGYPSDYYDMHGNAHESLQALMIGRFEFTQSICSELDSADRKSLPAYIAALYRVLAEVKDPSSIPWLKQQLAGPRRNEIYAHWLSRWETYLRGAGPEELKWLVGRERWSVFFREWAESETQPSRRTNLLRTIQGWLHEAEILDFFAELERNNSVDDQDLLIAQLYLLQHGKALRTKRLQGAIERLSKSNSGRKTLIEFADEMRHEAFTPWLLKVVEDRPREEHGNAQWVLEAITFRRDAQGHAAWQKWAAAHRNEGRKKWMEQASSHLFKLAKTNLHEAQAFMEKAMYRWKDPIMFPTMERLAEFKPLQSQIVGWINLTYGHYHHFPHLRERFRALALRIEQESRNELEDWAKQLMQGWDFLCDDNRTWEEFILLKNRAM